MRATLVLWLVCGAVLFGGEAPGGPPAREAFAPKPPGAGVFRPGQREKNWWDKD